MAFSKYKDEAWTEPESSVKKYQNGAWTDCETAKIYKNGAWTEVWANVKYMIQKSTTITKGILQIQKDDREFNFIKIMDYYDNAFHGSQDGGGTIIFYLDGEWSNPTISFDWKGGFIYKSSSGSTWNRVSSGNIKAYHRLTNGTTGTTNLVDVVGSTIGGASSVEGETGSYSGSLTGTYDQLGLSIDIKSFSGNYFNSSMTMVINNLLFAGRKIAFPPSSAFTNQEF